MNDRPRYAVYFVPDPSSSVYRFGSAVLGYDGYSGEALVRQGELARDVELWDRLTAEPRRYGFHATLKPPFRLAFSRSEAELAIAVDHVARTRHAVLMIEPAIEPLGGFVAIVPKRPNALLDGLAARCVTELDRFRAPISVEERERRLASGLTSTQVTNLDRWGYPHVLEDFRFHLTLTGRIDEKTEREAIVAILLRLFQRCCGDEPVRIDRLALVKQDSAQSRFRVIGCYAIRTVL